MATRAGIRHAVKESQVQDSGGNRDLPWRNYSFTGSQKRCHEVTGLMTLFHNTKDKRPHQNKSTRNRNNSDSDNDINAIEVIDSQLITQAKYEIS